MKGGKIIFLIVIVLIPVISASDVLVWQGQYYTGTTFHTGTYEFNFSVYDSLTEGNICYSNTTTLTTGNFGEWKTEQNGVSSACNNASKDYYLNINIDGIDQSPRKRLVIWNYLRKDTDEIFTGNLTLSGIVRTNSPLKIKQSMEYTNFNDEVVYSSFVQGQNAIMNDVPDIFNNSLIYLKIKSLVNDYGYKVVYFDNITKESLFTLSRNANGRASTMFNLMIVPENKTTNSSFNLCEGNYVDCASNEPDLLVYDDIETGGSIFSNENITAENFNIGGANRHLSSSGAGDLELAMTTPASTLNIKSGSGSGDSSEVRCTASSIYLTGDWIGLYGSSELWGSSNVFSNSENAFIISDDLNYEQTLRVDTINQTVFAKSLVADNKIQGNYYSDDGSVGITNTADYHVCTSWAGSNCNAWCTLRIKNGLIVGCA